MRGLFFEKGCVYLTQGGVMAQNTSHTASNNPNSVFGARGDQAKVLDKVTLPPEANAPTGRGVANNLVKITEIATFPVPENK
jgi:hypothetical protein